MQVLKVCKDEDINSSILNESKHLLRVHFQGSSDPSRASQLVAEYDNYLATE